MRHARTVVAHAATAITSSALSSSLSVDPIRSFPSHPFSCSTVSLLSLSVVPSLSHNFFIVLLLGVLSLRFSFPSLLVCMSMCSLSHLTQLPEFLPLCLVANVFHCSVRRTEQQFRFLSLLFTARVAVSLLLSSPHTGYYLCNSFLVLY